MPDIPKPGLLVPDHRVVSIDEAKQEEALGRRRQPERKSDLLTRRDAEDMLKAFAGRTAVEMAQRVHADIIGQTQKYLQDMELALQAHIDNEIFKRSWWGRTRTLLIRLGAKPKAPQLEEPEDEIVEEEKEAGANGE